MAVKNVQRPDWSKLPGTVGELSPKALFNLVRTAVQYETQESSDQEAPTWRGTIYRAIAGIFSSPEDKDPNINSVYKQTGNILYSELNKKFPGPMPGPGGNSADAGDES